MKFTKLTILTLCFLPLTVFTQDYFSFYKGSDLYLSSTSGEKTYLGTDLKIKNSKRFSSSVIYTYSIMPTDILKMLKFSANMGFYSAIQSPDKSRWVYVERDEKTTEYNLCLFDIKKQEKKTIFTNLGSPDRNYAFKPIAWGYSYDVIYLEALIFGSATENEGIWEYNLSTQQFAKLQISTSYITTPVISPDRKYLIYGGTSDHIKNLHSTINSIFIFDLSNKSELMVEEDPDNWYTFSGWYDSIKQSDIIGIDIEDYPFFNENFDHGHISALPSFKLPWQSGTAFCVSRTGQGGNVTQPPNCSGSSCGPHSGFHDYPAIDFPMPLNTNVLAAASGTVQFAWFNANGIITPPGGYGNLIKIRHSDGTYAYYAHLNNIGVKVGDVVSQGCLIGKAGNTGTSTGNHLHFETRDVNDARFTNNAGWPIFSEYNCTPNQNKQYTSQNILQNCTSNFTLNCSNAISITCGQSISGQTTGKVSSSNNVTSGDYSSVSTNPYNTWNDPGPEDVYKITVTSGATFTASLSNMVNGLDLDVFILNGCNITNNPGNVTITSTSATITNATAGTYYILVDGAQTQYPSGSGAYGHYGAYTLTITGSCGGSSLPDLTITGGTQSVSPETVTAGSNVTIACSENNIGNVSAGSNVVALYLSPNNILTPNTNGDVYIGYIQFPTVSANSSTSILSKSIQIPSSTIPGTYYVFFWADGNEQVVESIETNNFASKQITVNGTPPGPFNLTLTPECDGTTSQIRLNWTTSSGAATYDIYRNNVYYDNVPSGTQYINSGNITVGSTYSYYVKAKNASGATNSNTQSATAPYCNSTPTISISTTTLSNFGNVTIGNFSSNQSYSVSGNNLNDNLTITSPSGFEISQNGSNGWSPEISYPHSGGIVSNKTIYVRFRPTSIGSYSSVITHTSQGAIQQNISVSGTGVPPPPPTITVSQTSLPDFGNIPVGQNSSTQSYTVSGTNLTANLSITAPNGFQISSNSGSSWTDNLPFTPSGGTVSQRTILVRFSPAVAQSYSGNISHTSSGANTQTIFVSGTGGNITTDYTLTGTVTYDNVNNNALSNINVMLRSGSTVVGTSNSDNSGQYSIVNLSNGSYNFEVTTNKPWGGVNSTDALLVLRHSNGLSTLTGLKLTGADVNNSGNINSTDALFILRRSNGLTSTFPKGDWVFNNQNTISISGSSISHNFSGLAVGDVNGSYTPPMIAKGYTRTTELTHGGNISVKPNENFSVPITVAQPIRIGAMTLRIKYPEEHFRFIGIDFPKEGLLVSEQNGLVKFDWASIDYFNLENGQTLVELKFENINSTLNTNNINLEASDDTEFADETGSVIDHVSLSSPSVQFYTPRDVLVFQNFPNPFNPTTKISYEIPHEGTVTLFVYNVLGEKVKELVNCVQTAGMYNITWDAEKAQSGLYFYELHFTSGSKSFVQSGKMILSK